MKSCKSSMRIPLPSYIICNYKLEGINFYRVHGAPENGRRRKAGKACRRKGGGEFSAETSNQISLMKWRKNIKTIRVGSHGHPALRFLKLPSMAISPSVFDHFISEIADWKQQQKNQLPASPFPSCFRPFWPPSAVTLIKINFRTCFPCHIAANKI